MVVFYNIKSNDMTKLKKQVSTKKIAQFFKKNKYVLFFHYNGDTKLYSNLIKTKLFGNFNATPLFVKNKIAERFLSNHISTNQKAWLYPDSPQKEHKSTISTLSGRGPKGDNSPHILQRQLGGDFNLENLSDSEKTFKDSLFHGPTILLGVNNLESMQKIFSACKNEKLFLLFAAFYEQTVLNHLQVERLVALSHDAYLYPKLVKNMGQLGDSLVSTLTNCLFFHPLKHHQIRLFHLLQIQMYQLSKKSSIKKA